MRCLLCRQTGGNGRMPIYDQVCESCGNVFEVLVLSVGDTSRRPCPRCSAPDTLQLISLCAFRMGEAKFDMKRGRCHNPYENLILEHVRDERGKPIHVNSEAELHAAEKRYNFVHNATWGTEAEPPKQEAWAGDIAHNYRRKWNHDDRAYSQSEIDKVKRQSGWAESRGDTLADAPRPV